MQGAAAGAEGNEPVTDEDIFNVRAWGMMMMIGCCFLFGRLMVVVVVFVVVMPCPFFRLPSNRPSSPNPLPFKKKNTRR